MATPMMAPELESANIMPAGYEVTDRQQNFVLPNQTERPQLPIDARLIVTVLDNENFYLGTRSGRPQKILFGALHDPSLVVVRPIPLEISAEEATVIASWPDTDEFGTGETLSAALDDLAGSLRELCHELFAKDANLGPNLRELKDKLAEYIKPRK